ncbi:MAG: DedA family protein [Candidatus Delongbacteria bacterium]|nr:DedA family protein [Candidatus Delongbacteria bacterium]
MEVFVQDHQSLVFLLLFVAAYLENIIPPLPGDAMVILGAYLVGQGQFSLTYAVFFATAGSFGGFITYYYLGYRYGDRILNWKWMRRLKLDDSRTRISQWLERYGIYLILMNRFLSGARSAISLMTGIFKYRPLPVMISALIGSLIWNGILISAVIGLQMKQSAILDLIRRYNLVVGIIISAILIILMARWIRHRRTHRQKGNSPQ